MNNLDLLTNIYARLHNYRGIPYWVLTPFRKLIRKIANQVIPKFLLRDFAEPSTSVDVIVSLTSFPARIDYVWIVVESMLRQSFKPKKIILWLSQEQFPSKTVLPNSLLNRENEIFEIRLVSGDIRSHKKYYYVCKEYPKSLIFLVDDDIFYDTKIIERSFKARLKNPSAVICNYGNLIAHSADGSLLPYNTWKRNYSYSEDRNIFFGSGGGTMFCPSELFHDLSNIELALKLTPLADDIWLNAMVRLANIPVIMLKNGQILPVTICDDQKLAMKNRGEDLNDNQLTSIIRYYKQYNLRVFE